MARGKWGEITGMREARETLQQLARASQTAVGKRALRAPAAVLVQRVKDKAPVSKRASDPTPGSLRESVREGRASSRKGQARIEIIAQDIAAVPNEFGTSKMAAQPFFRPAVDAGREEAAQAMAEAVKSEVDAAAQRAAARAVKSGA